MFICILPSWEKRGIDPIHFYVSYKKCRAQQTILDRRTSLTRRWLGNRGKYAGYTLMVINEMEEKIFTVSS